jgi:hypothetical protein
VEDTPPPWPAFLSSASAALHLKSVTKAPKSDASFKLYARGKNSSASRSANLPHTRGGECSGLGPRPRAGVGSAWLVTCTQAGVSCRARAGHREGLHQRLSAVRLDSRPALVVIQQATRAK